MKKPIAPVIKWAGGKRRLAPQIAEYISVSGFDRCGTYYEPFAGGAALMFYLKPPKSVGIDKNGELINLYKVLSEHPNDLYALLKERFVPAHSEKFYYEIREWDRDKDYLIDKTDIERAARFLYLNKTCFNGIWRVNQNGCNNVPWNHRSVFSLPPKAVFTRLNRYLSKHATFLEGDYQMVSELAVAGDFVYFDPPYDVEENQSEFTAYTKSGFSRDDQQELKSLCDSLIAKGVKVAISNSDTPFIRGLYGQDNGYTTYEIVTEINLTLRRNISGSVDGRKQVTELLFIGRATAEPAK
jgi:DNA adenine methylase